MPTDQRGALSEEVFSWSASRDGKVFISWRGKLVTTLQGKPASKFLARIAGLDEHAAQLLLARVTGNFKRGNEGSSKP